MDREDVRNKLFEFAYTMAFQDATLRNAFQKWDDESEDSFHERKKTIKTNSREYVKNYIDRVFSGNIKDSSDVLKTIEKCCNSNLGFTFGNAQKLVNMTAKYMFLSAYSEESKRELFRYCHCPMDGVMLRKVKTEFPMFKLDSSFSWSKLEMENGAIPQYYIEFQEYIKRLAKKLEDGQVGIDLIPLEVDYICWE